MAHQPPGPIMIVGGSGKIGATLARLIRGRHPNVELLIAGRDLDDLEKVATELGMARAIAVDLSTTALPDLPPVATIVGAVPDPAQLMADHAIDHGVTYLAITLGPADIAPLAIRCAQRQPTRPIVPLGHYQAGGLLPLVGSLRRRFAQVDRVDMAALLDPNDPVGATTRRELDDDPLPALSRIDGRWETIDDACEIVLADGGTVTAKPLGTLDPPSVATLTDARWVRFDVALGDTIGTQAGGAASMDLYVDMQGWAKDGAPLALRMLASDPRGQAHFTAFNTLAAIDAAGITDRTGFCLPESLITPEDGIAAMRAAGITVELLE